jgi:hypothetical protein
MGEWGREINNSLLTRLNYTAMLLTSWRGRERGREINNSLLTRLNYTSMLLTS